MCHEIDTLKAQVNTLREEDDPLEISDAEIKIEPTFSNILVGGDLEISSEIKIET